MACRRVRLLSALAVLLAGCVQPAAETARVAVAPTPLAIARVTASSTGTPFTASASSTRNSVFAVAHLTDGNLDSAWSPAAADAAPTLVLSFAQSVRLTGLAVKMDAGATFDVQVSDGGGWSAIATGVAPTYRTMTAVGLPASAADHVRLVFHVQPRATLLVCELALNGDTAPMPAPAPVGLGFVGDGLLVTNPTTFSGVSLSLSAAMLASGPTGTLRLDSLADARGDGARSYRVTDIRQADGAWTFVGEGSGGATCTLTAHQTGDAVAIVDTCVDTGLVKGAVRALDDITHPARAVELQESVVPR
ncbi:MAG TPA: hypothetical protein V6D47_13645 [Oscillatoriaceae cyanobacterium]